MSASEIFVYICEYMVFILMKRMRQIIPVNF